MIEHCRRVTYQATFFLEQYSKQTKNRSFLTFHTNNMFTDGFTEAYNEKNTLPEVKYGRGCFAASYTRRLDHITGIMKYGNEQEVLEKNVLPRVINLGLSKRSWVFTKITSQGTHPKAKEIRQSQKRSVSKGSN